MHRKNSMKVVPMAVFALAIVLGWAGSSALAGLGGETVYVDENAYYEIARPDWAVDVYGSGSYEIYTDVDPGRITASYTGRFNAYSWAYQGSSTYADQYYYSWGDLYGRSRFYFSHALLNSFDGLTGSDSAVVRASSRSYIEVDEWDYVTVVTGPHSPPGMSKGEEITGVVEVRGRASLSGEGYVNSGADSVGGGGMR